MQQLRPRDRDTDNSPQPLMRRLDRAAAEMNVFLLVIALGLAGLFFTSFVALRIATLPMASANPASPSPAASGPAR